MRAYYASSIGDHLASSEESILGALTAASTFAVDITQRNAWLEEIRLLRQVLQAFPTGEILLEFVVPRLGKRIDVVLLVNGVLVIIEFKVGATTFARADVDQVWDYALDLKNFHETSHHRTIFPVLVITGAAGELRRGEHRCADGVVDPSLVTADRLAELLQEVVGLRAEEVAPLGQWESGRYRPTPTIIEAATSLYRRHSVKEIARHGADAKNLNCTAEKVAAIIRQSRDSGASQSAS